MESSYAPTLYLPEKYRVHVGSETNVALCTCWSDPTLLINKYSTILKNFAITGTLYSREGVSIIIRNLCLNPTIDTIILWAHGSLSNTAIGSAGRLALTSLWERGVDAEGYIKDIGMKIHAEITQDALELVRKHVKLIDMSDTAFDDVLTNIGKLQRKNKKYYMSSLAFPEPKREKPETMPSEKTGWSVRGKTITDTWIQAVDRIIRYGDVKKTESGSAQKELQSMSWTITGESTKTFTIPDWPTSLKNHIGLHEDMLTQYKQIFLTAHKPPDSAYTYGNRLYNYPGNINQIDQMIDKINKEYETRRAYATTFYPALDYTLSSPPCLTSVQFLTITNKRINMFAHFRSHDIFKAALPNAFGLLHLHQYVADHTGTTTGTLTITSVSAHIYEEDWQAATDTLKCSMWDRTKLYFDEHEDIDPRGLVRIALHSDRILLELVNESGEILFEYEGKSAREIAMKIARLELLSLPTHYVDVCIELTKAEFAMKTATEYIQDKPIKVGNKVIK